MAITRRRFLAASVCAAAGSALYAGEIERHWIEFTQREVYLPGLPEAFDGFRVVQLSDIHLDEFTEPSFLQKAVGRINAINPDAVFLTGDFITLSPLAKVVLKGVAEQCAGILGHLQCPRRYACLGNHDFLAGGAMVTDALATCGIPVLRNSCVAIERDGARFWLAGVEDPLQGQPDPEAAIPASIRNLPGEPVVLLCHGPDYVDTLLKKPAGQSVSLMLSGHTHGGQIRLPLIGPLILPPFGKKYVQGWFRFGNLQLHVNRGIGTVDLPLRLNCPPEISVMTLRVQSPSSQQS